MGQKLHRGRRHGFRRRSAVKPILGWILAAAVLIPASYFGARYIGNRREVAAVTPSTTQGAAATTTAATTAPVTVQATALRGITLSYTALRDTAALTAACKAAAEAGYTAAVVELKAKSGEVYYVSETEAGRTVGAAADALSLSALTDAFAVMEKAGLSPTVRLFAFEDAVAPKKLVGAKITTTGHDDWTWYDGDPKNGGKPWLNPYSDAAQAYIVSLCEELYTAGAGALLLDGVYFPTQTAQAQLAVGANAALSKAEVLKQFITRVHNLREDAPLLLCGSANAFLGNNTAGFDGNPKDFGATAIVPDLRLSSLGQRLTVGDKRFTVSADALSDITAAVTAALRSADAPTVVPLIDGGDAVKTAAGAYIQNDG